MDPALFPNELLRTCEAGNAEIVVTPYTAAPEQKVASTAEIHMTSYTASPEQTVVFDGIAGRSVSAPTHHFDGIAGRQKQAASSTVPSMFESPKSNEARKFQLE